MNYFLLDLPVRDDYLLLLYIRRSTDESICYRCTLDVQQMSRCVMVVHYNADRHIKDVQQMSRCVIVVHYNDDRHIKGSSTPPRYSPGAATPQSYSLGTSRNAECSNCKHLLGKITLLEATMDMYMHPEQHTVNSAALFHEVYSNMRKLDFESFVIWNTDFCRLVRFSERQMSPEKRSSPVLLFLVVTFSWYLSPGLQTKLLRPTSIVASGPNFDDALIVFNKSIETDFLSNPNEITTHGLVEISTWGGHTSDWLRTVPISGLEQTMNDGKEVDTELDSRHDKPLCPPDILLYSWDGGLDACVDLTRSSPLTQTELVDFVPGTTVIDDAQRKRGKYMDKCAPIRYGFFPFSFSSWGEYETNTVILLKRI
nr:auxilin-like protein [Tanacetum cinerariifolium]